MNAGAYQFSIGAVVEEVVAVSATRGRVVMPRGRNGLDGSESAAGCGLQSLR